MKAYNIKNSIDTESYNSSIEIRKITHFGKDLDKRAATIDSLSPSRPGLILMNCCSSPSATSVFEEMKILTGFFREAVTKSWTLSLMVAENNMVCLYQGLINTQVNLKIFAKLPGFGSLSQNFTHL